MGGTGEPAAGQQVERGPCHRLFADKSHGDGDGLAEAEREQADELGSGGRRRGSQAGDGSRGGPSTSDGSAAVAVTTATRRAGSVTTLTEAAGGPCAMTRSRVAGFDRRLAALRRAAGA
ncbi:hypothetical protein Ssi02_50320 [Sinosporangium siamense]|uniref:Uncharacterized protein n=1 Tax=Sinosporangium siamense TaxID=1367973 RepID=A0A919V906_9ACTN|nr:hypothetical protein Ssi02_50320 [Sinosporangium siamense]